MASENTSVIQGIVSLVLGRAARDGQFRAALLANPRDAVSQELGIELPTTVKIKAAENTAGQIVLTLPPDLEASLGQARIADCCDCCCC
jgi:hypothetical protein